MASTCSSSFVELRCVLKCSRRASVRPRSQRRVLGAQQEHSLRHHGHTKLQANATGKSATVRSDSNRFGAHSPALPALARRLRTVRANVAYNSIDESSDASSRPVIVWYKHDLRVQDHPGLSRALSSNRPVIGFFCFDADVLSDQSTELWGAQAVRGAVACLKESLRRLDCSLAIRQGDTASELLDLVERTGADVVVCESEVEYRWLTMQERVETELADTVSLKLWKAPIWRAAAYSTNYKQFCRARGRPQAPLAPLRPCEASWTPPDDDFEGDLPSSRDWQAAVEKVVHRGFKGVEMQADATPVSKPDETLYEEKGWVFEQLKSVVKGGEAAYQQLLQAFLTGQAAPAASGFAPQSKDMLRIAEELEAIPGNQSGSFSYIFKPALALGMLSRRQVYDAAVAQERARFGTQLPQSLWTPQARAAAQYAECGDYHVSLAHLLKDRPTQAAGKSSRKFWRWHGQMVDYIEAEPEGGATEDTPKVLLVHGFGAFAEHWRRNISVLASKGFHVYACTLPGFGPSEKSAQNYTTALWKAYVRDFAVHVVGQPVVVAGNSIGGVVPANACADHAHVFDGIVLINTAGSTETEWDPDNVPVKKPTSKLFADTVGWLTFQYLQMGIQKQLQKCYPVRPFNADKFLNDEIYRASCDPCSLQVLRSGFYLAQPRPLPYMLNQLYQRPVLIIQGVLDPLNSAADRADALEQSIDLAEKVCIEAGHCPHDETPELVNAEIEKFVLSLVQQREREEASAVVV